jgi:hypothetical protein
MLRIGNLLRLPRNWLIPERLVYVKYAIIIAVVLASGYIAPRVAVGNHLYPTVLFLLYAAFLGVMVFLHFPILGIFVVILGGYFVPFSGPGGFNLALIGVVITLIAWIMDMLIRQHRIVIIQSRTMKPIFFLMIVSLLSFGIGQLPWFSFAQQAPQDAQLGGLSIFLLSAGAFLMTAHLIKELYVLERLTWLIILLGGVYVIGRLLGDAGGIITNLYHYSIPSGSMFWTWLVALIFSQLLINKRLHMFWRLILAGLLAAALYVAYVINYDWKSGWMPPLVTIAAILSIRYWRVARYLVVLVALPAFYYLSVQAIATDQYSWGTRLDAWLVVLEIAKVSPILGLGFANYYWYARLFPIRGYFIRFNSHSQYIDLIAQTGIFGLIGVFWLFWEVSRLGLWLRDRVPDGFPRAYVYGVLGGVAGTIVAGFLVDWILPFIYNIGMNGFRASVLAWILMGGLVCVEQSFRKKTEFGFEKVCLGGNVNE